MAKKRHRVKVKQAVTFRDFDAANYLRSEEDMALYLDACMEEAGDDAGMIAEALGAIARAKGMTTLAKQTDITRAGLYKSLSREGKPSFETILKVIRLLGMKLTVQAA
jgi:probable addiction module antidote protein